MQLCGILQRHTGIVRLGLQGAQLDAWSKAELSSSFASLHGLTK